MRDLVYMLFLALESARHAIADLVEYEPAEAERTIVILISELEAYRFLCRQFPDDQDVHHQRIALRGIDYRYLVPRICSCVEAGKASEEPADPDTELHGLQLASRWEPAWRLLPELRRRYEAAMASTS
jgi:hypothetical protein